MVELLILYCWVNGKDLEMLWMRDIMFQLIPLIHCFNYQRDRLTASQVSTFNLPFGIIWKPAHCFHITVTTDQSTTIESDVQRGAGQPVDREQTDSRTLNRQTHVDGFIDTAQGYWQDCHLWFPFANWMGCCFLYLISLIFLKVLFNADP